MAKKLYLINADGSAIQVDLGDLEQKMREEFKRLAETPPPPVPEDPKELQCFLDISCSQRVLQKARSGDWPGAEEIVMAYQFYSLPLTSRSAKAGIAPEEYYDALGELHMQMTTSRSPFGKNNGLGIFAGFGIRAGLRQDISFFLHLAGMLRTMFMPECRERHGKDAKLYFLWHSCRFIKLLGETVGDREHLPFSVIKSAWELATCFEGRIPFGVCWQLAEREDMAAAVLRRLAEEVDACVFSLLLSLESEGKIGESELSLLQQIPELLEDCVDEEDVLTLIAQAKEPQPNTSLELDLEDEDIPIYLDENS